MKRLLLVSAVLGTVAVLLFSSGPAEAQWVKPTTSVGTPGVSEAAVYSILGDAGVPHSANEDFYANTFVATNRAADGGVGTYSFISNTDSCIKGGAGTQAEVCWSGNTTTLNASSVLLPTTYVSQPACRTGQNCLWYSDGWGPGMLPRGSLPTCNGTVEGGKVTLNTDHREYFCDGTTAQAVALRKSWSGSLDFPVVASGRCDDLTIAATGAVLDEPVACGGGGSAMLGDDDYTYVCAITATDVATVRLCCHDTGADCADLAAITFTVSALR